MALCGAMYGSRSPGRGLHPPGGTWRSRCRVWNGGAEPVRAPLRQIPFPDHDARHGPDAQDALESLQSLGLRQERGR